MLTPGRWRRSSKAEIATLVSELYPVMVSQNEAGHTLSDNARGRMLVDLIEKMDRQALIEAAEAIVPLTDPKLLDQLKTASRRRQGCRRTGSAAAW